MTIDPAIGPFFWGAVFGAMAEEIVPDTVRWWIRFPIKTALYVLCALIVSRFYVVISL